MDYDELVQLFRERERLGGQSSTVRSRQATVWTPPTTAAAWDWDWAWELNSLRRALVAGIRDAPLTAIAYLDADPYFYRSGYAKKRLLRDLRHRRLDVTESDPLRRLALRVVDRGERGCGYFREFTKLAGKLWSQEFESALVGRLSDPQPLVAGRAKMMLDQARRRRDQ